MATNDDYKKYIKELEDNIRLGVFKSPSEIQTANDMIKNWKSRMPQTTAIPEAPDNALRNVLAGTGVDIGWDQGTKNVTLKNPAANKTLQFPTGQGQQYGMAGGHVNDYNVVDNVNLLLDSLGLSPAAAPATMQTQPTSSGSMPSWTAPAPAASAPAWTAPAPYQSQYSDNIQALIAAIQGAPAFSYSPEDDPSYASYRDMYTREGKSAFDDQIGNLTAMTGGRLNSFATAAAAQSQNAYNKQLTDIIPQLEQSAYSRHQNTLQDKYNQIQTLLGLDSQDYGRYRDTVGDSQYGYETEYDQYRDSINDFLNQRNYDRSILESDRNYNRGVLESDRGFEEDTRRYDQNYDRDVFESDRSFSEDTRRYDQNYDRGILESDRSFNEDTRRYDQNYDRDVFESDRSFNRGVLESDRSYGLNRDEFDYRKQQDTAKADAEKPPTAGQLSNYNQIRDGLLGGYASPGDALAYVNRLGKEFYTDLIGENLYAQLLSDLQGGFQQSDQETMGAIYEAMMNDPDPEAWLKGNSIYMTDDEIKQAVKWLPKEQQMELLKQIFGAAGG